jgi:hypothetical protein
MTFQYFFIKKERSKLFYKKEKLKLYFDDYVTVLNDFCYETESIASTATAHLKVHDRAIVDKWVLRAVANGTRDVGCAPHRWRWLSAYSA